MKVPNDSASRIKAILQRFNERVGSSITAAAWSHAFCLPQDVTDYHLICEKLRCLASEIAALEITIKELEPEHEHYLTHFPAFRNATNPVFLKDSASSTGKAFNETALASLSFCALLVKRNAPEPEISETDLERISRDVDELLSQILKAEIRPKEKRMFVGLANALKQAIQDYQIGGAKMLRENFLAIVSKLADYAPPTESDAEKDEAGVFKRVMEILKDFQITTAVVINSNTIGRGIWGLLVG